MSSSPRLRHSIADLVRSMAVVLAVVAALLLVTWRPQPEAVREVDPQPVLALASSQADFPIAVPVGLRVTSVRWEPTAATGETPAWHIGGITPAQEYLQVGQTRADDPAEFIAEQSGDGVPAGSISIGGRSWTRLESAGGRGLSSTAAGVTTVIYGTGEWGELERAAASVLR